MFSGTTGTGIVSTEGSNYDTVLAVYTGDIDDLTTLTLLACTNSLGVNNFLSRLQFAAQPNTNYWLVVNVVNSATGSLALQYGISTNPPPTLDAISNPTPINEDAGLQTIDLSGISGGSTPLTVTPTSGNTALIPH